MNLKKWIIEDCKNGENYFSLKFFNLKNVERLKKKVGFPAIDLLKQEGLDLKANVRDYTLFMKKIFPNCEVVDCQKEGKGHPDFIIKKGEDKIYVEVKRDTDNLRKSQLEWFFDNILKESWVMFINSTINQDVDEIDEGEDLGWLNSTP